MKMKFFYWFPRTIAPTNAFSYQDETTKKGRVMKKLGFALALSVVTVVGSALPASAQSYGYRSWWGDPSYRSYSYDYDYDRPRYRHYYRHHQHAYYYRGGYSYY
jgi:hypothetical protein